VYTFIFAQATSADEAVRWCERALSAVAASLPPLGSPARLETLKLPEMRAAFATLKPELDVAPSLIQHASVAELSVLTSGDQAGTPNLASTVLQTYRGGGIDGVAAMDGNLSAVVIDRQARSIWVVGTLLGHRSLFYWSDADTFLVSPHDLTLIAARRFPVSVDPISLASMAACDWSLGGRSLVQGVARCHPLEAVRWREGELTRRPLPHPFEVERLDPRDARGIQRQVDRVADRTMEYVESHTAGLSRVQCSLTAGMDSRAVFAALCGAKGAGSIDTTTSGGEHSLDVVVARRLARMVGASHRQQEPVAPTTEDFVGSTRLRAFLCSGDTNAKRSMSRLPRVDPSREWSAGGNGGEIYRGFFYQYFGVTGVAPRSTSQLAERLLSWRFRRLAKLPFADPGFAEGVRERLLGALQRAERCSSDPYDIVDLLYLFERYGRWGSAPAALPWQRSWTPFESIAAIREAFRLPSPVGKRCTLHAALVRRFLPARAYWTPINGGQLLALDGDGRARYALRQALNASSVALQRVSRRLRKGARRGDDMKTEFLTGPLRDSCRDLLLENDSISQVLFGPSGVHQLFDAAHREGLGVVGVLLTAEMWRHLAQELSRAPHI
jgi:hypothetical protein